MPVPASSWLSLSLLTLTYAIYVLDKYIVAVVIEPLKLEFNLTDSEVGLFTGLAGTLPFLLTCVPLAMLADRVNRKWLLIVLVVSWSACTGLSGFATSMLFLTLARVVVAALEAGFTPLSMSLMTDKFPPHRRPTAMGLFNVGAQIGIFLGLAVGGLVVAEYGWRWAFFIAGIPGLIMGVVLAVMEREPVRGAYDTSDTATVTVNPEGWRFFQAFGVMYRTPLVFYGSLGLLACATLPATVGVWMPSFLIRVHGMTVQQAGFVAAIIGLVGALGAGSGGIFADRIGRTAEWRKVYVPILGSVVAVVAGVFGYLVFSDTWLVVTLLALMIFAQAWYSGVGYALTLGNSPAAVRGTVIAIVLVATNVISAGLGNVLVGVISDLAAPIAGTNSISYGMAASLVFTLIGALLFWRALLHIRRNSASTDQQAVV